MNFVLKYPVCYILISETEFHERLLAGLSVQNTLRYCRLWSCSTGNMARTSRANETRRDHVSFQCGFSVIHPKQGTAAESDHRSLSTVSKISAESIPRDGRNY